MIPSPRMTAGLATAAFLRVEETLLPRHAVRASLALATASPGLGERWGRLGALAAAAPLLAGLGVADRRLQARLCALHLRGLSADRVALLAPEAFAGLTAGDLRPGGLEVIERARRHGHRVVLVTSGLQEALAPVAAAAGADALVGGALELRDDAVTGRLLPPSLLAGPGAVAEFAAREGIELRGSYAYGSDLADLPLLGAVGFPCVVNPDWRLAREARLRGWPLLRVAGEVSA